MARFVVLHKPHSPHAWCDSLRVICVTDDKAEVRKVPIFFNYVFVYFLKYLFKFSYWYKDILFTIRLGAILVPIMLGQL